MNLLPPKVSLCSFVSHPSSVHSSPGNHWSLFCHYILVRFVYNCIWTKANSINPFCCCLASLTRIVLRFVMCISVVFLLLSGMLLHGFTAVGAPFTCWWTFGLLTVLGYYREEGYGPLSRHMLSFLLGRYSGVEGLDCMVSVCLAVRETAKLFYKVILFCIPTSTWYGRSHSSGCVVLSHCGFNLTCISVMTDDVEPLFMCLFWATPF